jgi:hypothetical protein
MIRPLRAFAVAALPALLASCGGDGASTCQVAQAVTWGNTPLAAARELSLTGRPDGHAVAAVLGDEARAASVAGNGALGTEVVMPLPPRLAGPWLATVATENGAPELLAVYLAARGDRLTLLARSQPFGGSASDPSVVADLPVGATTEELRVAFRSTRSGKRALLAWGLEGRPQAPVIVLLGAGAAPVRPPAPLLADPLPGWRCLAVSAGRPDVSVGLVQPAETPGAGQWRLHQFRDDGSSDASYTLRIEGLTGCPTVAPTPQGYVLGHVNADGLSVSEYDAERNVSNTELVAGAIRFGGAGKVPPVDAIAHMGRDFGLLLRRATGPELWRLDVYGNPRGAALALPSARGDVGPVAWSPGDAALWLTYLDRAAPGMSAQDQRYFLKVTCPTP